MPRSLPPNARIVNDYQLRRILDLEYSEAAEELCAIARSRPTIWSYPMVEQWMRLNARVLISSAAAQSRQPNTPGVSTTMRPPHRIWSTKKYQRPEPPSLVIGQIERVPLTRDGFEVIRSPNQSSKPNAKGKIVNKVFHGKGPALWRVELRTQMGNGYSTEYVRCRTSKQAEQHIKSKFHVVGKAVI